jgi:hypothetical protein
LAPVNLPLPFGAAVAPVDLGLAVVAGDFARFAGMLAEEWVTPWRRLHLAQAPRRVEL